MLARGEMRPTERTGQFGYNKSKIRRVLPRCKSLRAITKKERATKLINFKNLDIIKKN